MSKYLVLIVLVLWIGAGDWTPPTVPTMVIENDVVMGNTLPEWGTVCVDSPVRGGPDEMYQERYSVSAGTVVRLHELSNPDGTWVSVGAAQWMPLKNICDWNGE